MMQIYSSMQEQIKKDIAELKNSNIQLQEEIHSRTQENEEIKNRTIQYYEKLKMKKDEKEYLEKKLDLQKKENRLNPSKGKEEQEEKIKRYKKKEPIPKEQSDQQVRFEEYEEKVKPNKRQFKKQEQDQIYEKQEFLKSVKYPFQEQESNQKQEFEKDKLMTQGIIQSQYQEQILGQKENEVKFITPQQLEYKRVITQDDEKLKKETLEYLEQKEVLKIKELEGIKSQLDLLQTSQTKILDYVSTETDKKSINTYLDLKSSYSLNETEQKYSEIDREFPQSSLSSIEIMVCTVLEVTATLFIIQPMFIFQGLSIALYAVLKCEELEILMISLEKTLFSIISTFITVINIYYLFFEDNYILRASFFNIFMLQITHIAFFSIFKGSKFSIFYYYKHALKEQDSHSNEDIQSKNNEEKNSLFIQYLKWLLQSIFESEKEILGLNTYKFKDSNYNNKSNSMDDKFKNNAWLISQDIFYNKSSWQFEIIKSAREQDILIQLQRFKYFMEKGEKAKLKQQIQNDRRKNELLSFEKQQHEELHQVRPEEGEKVKLKQQIQNDRRINELLSFEKQQHEELHQVRPTFYLFIALIIMKLILFLVCYTILFEFNLDMALLMGISLILNIRILYNISCALGSFDLRIKSLIIDKLKYQITYLEHDIKLEQKIDISNTMSLATWNNARKILLNMYSKQQSIFENCYQFFILLIIIYAFICYLALHGYSVIPLIFRDNPIVLIQFLLDIPIFLVFIIERVYYSSQFNNKFKDLGTEIQKIRSLAWETLNDLDNYFFNNIDSIQYEDFILNYQFSDDAQQTNKEKFDTYPEYSMNLLLIMKVKYLQRLHIDGNIPYQGKKWIKEAYALEQKILKSIVNQFNQIYQEQEADILTKQHKILNVTSIDFNRLAISIAYSLIPILTTFISYIYPYFQNMVSSK